ncbi:MAG: hypothetical protein HYT77_07955 [Deltaproteobacteria bacterium]|nr:hypothetical protein [Deltaproteobacteria bacterium]
MTPDEKTYGENLRDRGFSIIHAGKQGAMVSDVYRYLEDEAIRHFPDYVILHFGIVESSCRAQPRWLQGFLSLNDWQNNITGQEFNSGCARLFKAALRKAYRQLVENFLYTAGLSWRWLSPKDFRSIYLDVIQRLLRQTSVRKIQLIGITPVTEGLERRLPGTRASTKVYNAIMEEISRKIPNTLYIDVDTPEFSSHTIDGIHFTPAGHKLLADKIEINLAGDRTSYSAWSEIKPFPLGDKLKKWTKQAKQRNGIHRD